MSFPFSSVVSRSDEGYYKESEIKSFSFCIRKERNFLLYMRSLLGVLENDLFSFFFFFIQIFPGVLSARVCLLMKRADVTVDSQLVDGEQVADVLTRSGFPSTVIENKLHLATSLSIMVGSVVIL